MEGRTAKRKKLILLGRSLVNKKRQVSCFLALAQNKWSNVLTLEIRVLQKLA